METINAISKKIQKELKKVIGIEVFVEFVNAAKPYVFLEWQGNAEEVKSKLNTYFENKCTDFAYDEDFNFASCAIYL